MAVGIGTPWEFFISRTKDAFTLSFGARQENIKGSFDAAIGVVEQLRQHSITQSELDRAKVYQRNVAERVYNSRSDRKNSYYVRKAQNNFLDVEPLSKVLTGKTIRLTPSVGDGKQSISGSSSIKDARTLFQLTWLYFTQPRYDKNAFNSEASPNVSYNDTITKAVYGDNLRTAPLKLKDLERVDYDRIYEIYKDRFGDATGFRMTVIGNLSPDSLRPLLEKYIASLPAKGRKNVAADTYLAIIGGVHNHEWMRETATPQSNHILYLAGEVYGKERPCARCPAPCLVHCLYRLCKVGTRRCVWHKRTGKHRP